MAEIKGKFISLTASLMQGYEEAINEADQYLLSKTGKHWRELEPEGWYSLELYNYFISAYAKASFSKEQAIITLGRNIYPTIKRTAGLPPELKTPIDYIKFELQGYLENLRGPEIMPRKALREEDGYIVIESYMKEQPCKLLEGVYLGILEMIGIEDGKVEHKKCIQRGDPACEFHITWPVNK